MKPKVTVIRAQGKPLLVCRSGPLFVAAFTWSRLIDKFARGAWKRIDSTTLEERLP